MRSSGKAHLQNRLDKRAIENLDYSLPGLLVAAGLTLRQISGLTFNTPSGSNTDEATAYAGEAAYRYILADPQYQSLFHKYNISKEQYSSIDV